MTVRYQQNAVAPILRKIGTTESVPRKRGNKGKRENDPDTINLVTAFDIETTRLDGDNAIMYIWQWDFDGDTVYGRTWEEWHEFINLLLFAIGKRRLIVYVHNLSYEWQFLRGQYDFTQAEVFAVKSRKILKASMYEDAIEMRCSYLHSNMSLAKFMSSMGVEDTKQKLSGFDYNIKRYPWTPLTEDELRYCINDVVGLTQAIKNEMAKDGDTLLTIPMTSTGYVRRDIRKAVAKCGKDTIKGLFPDYEVYSILRKAFRGGDTHANRAYTGDILTDVKSVDRSSSYPDVLINEKYPVSEFHSVSRETLTQGQYETLIEAGKAVICCVEFENLSLKNPSFGCPYLSYDKADGIRDFTKDNGRILKAGYCKYFITDVDYQIISRCYKWDMLTVTQCYVARYGNIPKPIKSAIMEYYHAKTQLKGIDEYYYMKSKNKLNSIYGMSAQDPGKIMTLFTGSIFATQLEVDETYTKEKAFEDGVSHATLPYQWGVWTTAHARARLHDMIHIVGEGFVYCDTDSVKYVDLTGDIERKIEEYNAEHRKTAIANNAFSTDPKGKTHYLGDYEVDGKYDRFRTWGAKKYAYVVDGKLSVTIAGVGKKAGAIELSENGGLEAFKPGFIFTAAGGTESVYNDDISKDIEIDGHNLKITSNICIRPSTYTVSIAQDYMELLDKLYVFF